MVKSQCRKAKSPCIGERSMPSSILMQSVKNVFKTYEKTRVEVQLQATVKHCQQGKHVIMK